MYEEKFLLRAWGEENEERNEKEETKEERKGRGDGKQVKQESVTARVKKITELFPCTKGSYNLLHAYYYWYFHARKFGMPFREILALPSSESISRAFRRLVARGEIKLSEKTLAKRAKYMKPRVDDVVWVK